MAIKISFSSLGDPKMPLEKFAALLGAAGYDAVELRGRPGEHVHWQDSAARRGEVKKILGDAGLEIAAVSTYLFLASRDSGGAARPDTRNEQENSAELSKFVELAADLGAANVRVFGGALSAGETMADALPRVARVMAAGARVNPQVNVCLETHDIWSTGTIVAKVLNAAALPNCKALWDVHGTEHSGESVRKVLKALGPERIAYLHVKDDFMMPGREQPYQCLIGAGVTPVREIVTRLKKAGWSGYVDVEWEGVYNSYMPPVDVAIVQCIMKLREYVGK
jgi:sugar phosphate isomerase/epimerase